MITDRLLELINEAEDGYTTYSNFITPNEYKKLGEKYQNIYIKSFGKLRKMLAFVPEYLKDEEIIFPIKLIKISVNNKFREYSNKDFLGSIMGLNISRDYVGDIFVESNTAYAYVHEKIYDYIINNLNKIGINECKVEVITKNMELDFKFESKTYTISSTRLDNVISAITNMSRTKTQEYISLGLAQLDYEVCQDNSKEVTKDMIISLKGYGRFIFSEIKRLSSKNKPVIEIKKYV